MCTHKSCSDKSCQERYVLNLHDIHCFYFPPEPDKDYSQIKQFQLFLQLLKDCVSGQYSSDWSTAFFILCHIFCPYLLLLLPTFLLPPTLKPLVDFIFYIRGSLFTKEHSISVRYTEYVVASGNRAVLSAGIALLTRGRTWTAHRLPKTSLNKVTEDSVLELFSSFTHSQ